MPDKSGALSYTPPPKSIITSPLEFSGILRLYSSPLSIASATGDMENAHMEIPRKQFIILAFQFFLNKNHNPENNKIIINTPGGKINAAMIFFNANIML
ncbi:hypothetical protein JZK55_10640 [Dissulfurispira thermophila]|uniref:Uncharacterized protein n=1 Tax=Dissulfurispira thermophila TaxID=2715679 RepID=A0A7G1H1N7_9BACT|nr:hypothetical protein JZK55_10640 [Dissulfurispira thermophila]